MNRFKKTYIVCWAKKPTGGVETLHQLCHLLNEYQLTDCFIYYKKNKKLMNYYRNYNIKSTNRIEDNKRNLLIVPESSTYILNKYKKINKVIWWLSLDYFFRSKMKYRVDNFINKHYYMKLFKPLLYGYLWLQGEKNIFKFENGNEIYHFYNCEYEKMYLINNGIPTNRLIYLCGPLSDIYFKQNRENIIDRKEDIVAYNPAKGKKNSEKIIEYFKEKKSDIKFIAIQNMTENQVCELLKNSKVYMDFGYFPGPERIPRQAVMLYCNIITSMEGAAENDVDVLIPRKYKFKDVEKNFSAIYKQINDFIFSYDKYVNDFEEYRLKVINQKKVFADNISKFFGQKEKINE